MNTALILGCSHAAGTDLRKNIFLGGYQSSYPALIAKKLGYKPNNRAIPGGSNDAMFRIANELIPTMSKSTTSLSRADIIIACWTGCMRTEIYSDIDQCHVTLCAGIERFSRPDTGPESLYDKDIVDGPESSSNQSLYYQRLKSVESHRNAYLDNQKYYKEYLKSWAEYDTNQQKWQVNKIKNIIALNALASSYGIRVLNFNSFDPLNKELPMYQTYEWVCPDIDFFTWCEKHNFEQTATRHFLEPAHEAFAEYAIQNLQKTV